MLDWFLNKNHSLVVLITLDLALRGAAANASAFDVKCLESLQIVKTRSFADHREDSSVASFMSRMGSLDAFSAREEKEFFSRLVQIESRLISRAIDRGQVEEAILHSRRDRIRAFIHPLLSKRNDMDFKASHPDLLKEIFHWDEMRDEFIRRNLGLLVHVVTRYSSPKDWEYHFGQQLFTLNMSFEGFEPELDFKFSSYVYHSIRKRMRDDSRKLRSGISLGAKAEYQLKKLMAIKHDRKNLGLPSIEIQEVTEIFSVSEQRAKQIMGLVPLAYAVDLDAQAFGPDSEPVKNHIAAPEAPSRFDDTQRLKILFELSEYISSEKVRPILELLKNGKSQAEMAQFFGMTKQGVMHHVRKILVSLKALVGLLSGAINQPKDRRLIIRYFGLFGSPKKSISQLADELRMKPRQIKSEVFRILDRVEIDDIDALIDQGASSR